MAHQIPLVLGIDGGGTKTVAWLALLEPETDLGTRGASAPHSGGGVLGRGTAGPGNPRAAGFETAQSNIDAAIDAAFADAKLPRQSVVAACFGLAGCGRAEEQEQMTAWAESRGIAYMLQVTTDAEPILAAASPENWGIALICGTGSLAWGRNQRGETARAGGWGYLIGDEGSGYAIALAGLRAAMCAADSRGPRTKLLSRFQQELDAATPEELIGRVYAAGMTHERIASLATTVFDVAKSDEVARDVVELAALHLAEMVAAVAECLQLPSGGYPLALTGGVLLNQPKYRRLVRQEVMARGTVPADEILVAEPVAGAVVLARRVAVPK